MKRWISFVNRKDWQSSSSSYICIKYVEEKYYKKVKNSKRYRLAMNMKPFRLYSNRKKLTIKIQKQSMLPHQSVFFEEHRGNIYIKKINMNHLSQGLIEIFTYLNE